ncbi:MAG TPA: 16S rRNA (adenine(1518)-N(6)/adenine(1519)-N(6))-dimethyltransferase RsmA [Gemmatimonadales bacterium]|nr:16S rRNA (adenine(1518)-N(6)/adenine(1519)-N(6))-dimethyltransferase RsmA [Gemmatimonadales bacterium]
MTKRSLGQHFLFDPRILARIAAALEPRPGEIILEIGPGRGTLTRQLLKLGPRVIVIEKDRELLPVLERDVPEAIVVQGDALELDWHAVAGGPFIVIGNIPYNITSPLIDQALTPPRPRVVVFLVQKEVAERVAAKPGGAEYGALSVGVQSVARVERLFNVAAGAFSPPPRVDSSVLRLTPLEQPLIPDEDGAAFRRMVVGLFGFRRKQLIRGVRELTGLPAADAGALLARAALKESVRPQELSAADFVRLLKALRG